MKYILSTFQKKGPALAIALTLPWLAVGLPTAAHAQMVLEEVVVTARKREETLQDTPIAVSAFTGEALRAAQINNVSDLTRNVPGLSRREGRKTADLNIRGVGTRSPGVQAEPGVGVYVDSIYVPRNDTQLVDVLDVESVQVLRGPQGTLFGKNTAGGALLLTTKKPGQENEGFASANIGDLGRSNFRAGFSGPLVTDTLYGGLQLDYRKEDGYREDARTGTDFGDVDRQSVLAQLRYEPNESFVGDLLLFFGDVDENTAPANCIQATSAPLQNFTAPGVATPFNELCAESEELIDDEKVLFDRSPLPYKISNMLAGLTMAWELETVTIKSITGYLYQDDMSTADNDVDATNLFTLSNQAEPNRQLNANGIDANNESRRFFSQELQLLGDAFDEKLSYTVGLFYSHEEINDSPFSQLLGPGGFLGIDLGNGEVSLLPASIGFREAAIRDFENTSFALFGQAIIDLSDHWQLTLGGRYTYEEKQAEQANYAAADAFPVGNRISREAFDALETYIHDVVPHPTNPIRGGKDDWNEFSPSLTLTMFTPDSWSNDVFDGGMIYASASNGFKAGGFSPFGDDFLAFDPENLWSYELGYKLELWGQRARINGSFYYSDYEDIQITVTRVFPREDPTLPPITLNGTTNAGEATIWGAELEFTVIPADGWFLAATASYINAEYDEFVDEGVNPDGTTFDIDRSSEDFAYTPEQSFSLTAQYEWATSLGSVTPRLSYYYIGSQFIGLDSAAAATDQAYLDSFDFLNLRVAVQPEAFEGLEIAAYVNNLTDEQYFGAGIASINGIGAVSLVPGKQRTWGIELHYGW
ncbi:MAG: TonB-dependent receptor [Pseudomonadota bacterium]